MSAGGGYKPGTAPLQNAQNETFVGRWSRRKRAEPDLRQQEDASIAVQTAEAEAIKARNEANALAQARADAEQQAPADLPPVESLTKDSDYTRFMQPDVPRASRNAAMKKLFTDPHFNVMDGLDTYIDDYTKEDPIPESMLRELAQSKMLGLFDDKKDETETGLTVLPADEMPVAAAQTEGTLAPAAQAEVTQVATTPPAAAPEKLPAALVADDARPRVNPVPHEALADAQHSQPYNPPAPKSPTPNSLV